MALPHRLYVTYVRTTPGALWQALSDPERTQRYFFAPRCDPPLSRVLPSPTTTQMARLWWPARCSRSSRSGGWR